MFQKSSDWLKDNWIYLIIFIILLIFRLGAIENKTTFFFDDPASLNVSTPNNLFTDGTKYKYGWADIRFESGRNYNVLEIKKLLFESKPNFKSICKDLATLHNTTLDRQHPNLYYSILRVWTAGMDYSDSNAIKWRGCSLNLIFFMFSFFFMFKLLNLIRPEKKFIALGLFFAFVTTGTISNTLLIRPYPLMETFFIFTLYLFLVLFNAVGKDDTFTRKKTIIYGLGLGTFFLTGYYSLFLAAFVLIAMIYKCLVLKDIKSLKRCLLIYGIAFAFTYLFCPLYFDNFKAIEHMRETQDAANFLNFTFFHNYGIYMLTFLSKFIFNNIVLFMILLVLYSIGVPILNDNKLEKEEFKNLLLVVVAAFSWSYLICTIAPFHEPAAMRYIIPAYPVLGLILAYIVYHFKPVYLWIMILITVITTALPIFVNINWYNSKYKLLGEVTYFKDYNWLNPRPYLYNHRTKSFRPVVLANRNWIWTNYILYLNNDNTVRFEDSVPPSDNYVFDDYLLINVEKMKIINKNNR